MAALQEGRGRQDDVGVTTRFVAVDVDAYHEFKIFEGGLEATRIRRRESGVSSDCEEGSDLPLTGFLDFVCQGRDGKFAHHLGKVPDAAPPATGFEAPAPRSFSGSGTRGQGKHRPTGPIEFSGQNIQYIGGPRGQGAKANRVNADSSVDDPALGMGQFSGQSPDDGRVHTAALGHPLGRKGLNGYAHLFEAVYMIGNVPQIHEILFEEDMDHGHQHHRIGARSHEKVFVGEPRRSRAPRIEDDNASSPLANGFQPSREIRCCTQATVGFHGVRTQHQ